MITNLLLGNVHLASRAFLSRAIHALDFGVHEKDCVNQVRSLLSMRCMLLGYSFEPRPDGRALGTC